MSGVSTMSRPWTMYARAARRDVELERAILKGKSLLGNYLQLSSIEDSCVTKYTGGGVFRGFQKIFAMV